MDPCLLGLPNEVWILVARFLLTFENRAMTLLRTRLVCRTWNCLFSVLNKGTLEQFFDEVQGGLTDMALRPHYKDWLKLFLQGENGSLKARARARAWILMTRGQILNSSLFLSWGPRNRMAFLTSSSDDFIILCRDASSSSLWTSYLAKLILNMPLNVGLPRITPCRTMERALDLLPPEMSFRDTYFLLDKSYLTSKQWSLSQDKYHLFKLVGFNRIQELNGLVASPPEGKKWALLVARNQDLQVWLNFVGVAKQ